MRKKATFRLGSTYRHYLDRSPQYYQQKAKNISEDMFSFIQQVFEQNKFPEQLYKTCDGIFSMARKTEISVFNKACQIALKHKNFSYDFIKNLIQNYND